MKVKHLTETIFQSVSPYLSLSSVEAQLLRDAYLVVMDGMSYFGVLTPTDIVKSPYQIVGDCLHEKPIIDADDELETVMPLMASPDRRVLPVFHQGTFYGVLRQRKIVEYLSAYHIELNNTVKMRTEELSREITRRKESELHLKAALDEKEILLSELFHRTKNHMQMILSMMILKSMSNPSVPLSEFVNDMERRIMTIDLVHQQLYQSQNLSRIPLRQYLENLFVYFRDNFADIADGIVMQVRGDESTVLFDIAIPCGILIHELVSNSIQHAFPGRRSGSIDLLLIAENENRISLQYKDNGIGLPAGFDCYNQQTLGLKTITSIVQNQLQGSIQFESQDGLTCIIRFCNNIYESRI